MHSVDIKDLILFTKCPLKWEHKVSNGLTIDNLDCRMIVAKALRDTMLKTFHMIGLGKKWSYKAAYGYFSRRWVQLKKEYEKNGGSPKPLTKELIKAQEKIMEFRALIPEGYEVAAANIPYERKFTNAIIQDKIDVLMVHTTRLAKKTRVELIVLDDSMENNEKASLEARLRLVLGMSYVKKALLNKDVHIEGYVINTYHGKKFQVPLNIHHKMRYGRIIKSILVSMESKLLYPVANENNCKHCIAVNNCLWSCV